MDPEKAPVVSGGNSISSGEQPPMGEKTDADAAADEAPARTITGVKWFLVCSSILSSIFLFALDNTIVADVQPKVIERFSSIEKLPWLSVAFLLGAVSTNLTWYVYHVVIIYSISNVHLTVCLGARCMASSMPNICI